MSSLISIKWFSIVNVLLLALLSYVMAEIIWLMMLDNTENQAPPVQQITQQGESTLPVTELSRRINQLHPFGKIAAAPSVTKPKKKVIEAPETRLNYKLRGIYYSDNKQLSSAIIVIKNTQSKSYQIGDEIEKGIKLHDIALNSVVLDRYGKFETLSLEKKKLNQGSSKTRFTRNTDTQHNQILKQYKQRFVNNPMALARRFRAIPVTKNGRNMGFKLQAVGGETLLKKLDVPKDAIFTAINGVSLAKPFQALEALKSLQTAKKVSVTFQLNGVEQTRNFDL